MLAPAHRPERVLAVVAHPDDAELLPFGRCGGGVRGDGSQPAPSRDRPRPGRAWRLSALPMTVRRPRTGGEAARVAPAGAAFRGVPRLLTSRVRRPQPARDALIFSGVRGVVWPGGRGREMIWAWMLSSLLSLMSSTATVDGSRAGSSS